MNYIAFINANGNFFNLHAIFVETKYSYMTVLIKIATELPKEVLLPEMSSVSAFLLVSNTLLLL